MEQLSICHNWSACALERGKPNYWGSWALEPMLHKTGRHHQGNPAYHNYRVARTAAKTQNRKTILMFKENNFLKLSSFFCLFMVGTIAWISACYFVHLYTFPEWKAGEIPPGSAASNGRVMTMRESFPRQIDKESRGPQGERRWEFSWRKKGQTFFFPSLHSLGLDNNNVSCLRTVSGLNLLANSVVLKCKLWE